MAGSTRSAKIVQLLSRPTCTQSISTKSPITYTRRFQHNASRAMKFQPRIAIVGGGPAGLTMGVLLHKHRIPFTIFELRQKPSEEQLNQPSGMLDLHEESGLAAIRECGLYDGFVPLTGECTEDFIVADRDGKVLFTHGDEGTRPEISRNNLTKLLLSNLPKESMKWEHKLLSATRIDSRSLSATELDFGTHGKHTFDLVVGADGAWSKVRRLLTDTKPQFTGMHIITVTIREITKKYPHLARLIGSGTFSSLGNKHAVISQRGPIDSSRIYLWLTVPDEKFATNSGLAGRPATNAKDELFKSNALLGNFGGPVKELVATACDEEAADHPGENLDIRALYTIPHGTSWEHKPGATLVGDGAHLMLPNGEGVNQAMLDSLLLSNAIVKAYKTADNSFDSFQNTIDPLLKEYETALVERAREIGKETEGLIGHMFGSDDAAHGFAKIFREMTQQHPEQ